MPIYEYYSPDTHRIYSFYAKTLAQGQRLPRCPDDPRARMVKLVSGFAVVGARKATAEARGEPEAGGPDGPTGAADPRGEAAMAAMEREFSGLNEEDPKAMARMMRRMAELAGERLDGPMEEAVRKLEEGADPESLEAELGDAFGDEAGGADDALPEAGAAGPPAVAPRTPRRRRRGAPARDPVLHDYD